MVCDRRAGAGLALAGRMPGHPEVVTVATTSVAVNPNFFPFVINPRWDGRKAA